MNMHYNVRSVETIIKSLSSLIQNRIYLLYRELNFKSNLIKTEELINDDHYDNLQELNKSDLIQLCLNNGWSINESKANLAHYIKEAKSSEKNKNKQRLNLLTDEIHQLEIEINDLNSCKTDEVINKFKINLQKRLNDLNELINNRIELNKQTSINLIIDPIIQEKRNQLTNYKSKIKEVDDYLNGCIKLLEEFKASIL